MHDYVRHHHLIFYGHHGQRYTTNKILLITLTKGMAQPQTLQLFGFTPKLFLKFGFGFIFHWFLLSFKVLVLDYWFCFSASFTCKLSCIIKIWPQICKQTKYKIHTENWFWLCTCTIMGILVHYSQNHWPEWTCQSWGYFVIYKLLVQGSSFCYM